MKVEIGAPKIGIAKEYFVVKSVNGKVLISGKVNLPSPCHRLQPHIRMNETLREIVIFLRVIKTSKICIQVLCNVCVTIEIPLRQGLWKIVLISDGKRLFHGRVYVR